MNKLTFNDRAKEIKEYAGTDQYEYLIYAILLLAEVIRDGQSEE